MSIQIDRCICFKKPFEELKQLAHKHGAQSLESLQSHVEFGLKCQLCHPYVRRMLRTGETLFTEILSSEDEGL